MTEREHILWKHVSTDDLIIAMSRQAMGRMPHMSKPCKGLRMVAADSWENCKP